MPASNAFSTGSAPCRRGFLKASAAGGATAALAGLSLAADQATRAEHTSQPERSASAASRSRSQKRATAPARGCPPEVRAALSGPWPSVRTPFEREGQIDFQALNRQIDFVLQARCKAVVLTWGDSLFSILTDEEIAQLTRAVVRQVDKRAFVVAATGTWWTGKSVDFAKYCRQLGADMLMVLPPDWAHSTTLESLVAHYRAVSEHIPVMLVTNFLIARGPAFGLELVRRLLREAPGVIAVKDDMLGEFIRKTGLLTHDRWALAAGGQKQNHMNMLPYGADGYLSTFLTFKPEIAWRYWQAIEAGDLEAATAVIRDYDMPFFDYILGVEGSFDAALHGIYELLGLASRYRRPPYHALTDPQMEGLADFLRKKKLL